MKLLKLALVIVVLSCANLSQSEAATGGTVLLVKGAVTATDTNKIVRLLAKGAAILEGDVINTSLKGFAVLRMIDNTKLTLKPSTTIAIGKFNDEEGKEEACINLVKGGLRTVTGLIGKRRPEAFQVDTPIASIGIRGTDFIVRVCAGDECLTDEQKLQQTEVNAEQKAERTDVAEAINEQLPEGLYGSCETGAITMSQCGGQVSDFELGKCRTAQQVDCTEVELSAGKAGYAGLPVETDEISENSSQMKGENSEDEEGSESSEESSESSESSEEGSDSGEGREGSVSSKGSEGSEGSETSKSSGGVVALSTVPLILAKDPHFALSDLSDAELAVIGRVSDDFDSQGQCSN